MKHPALTRVFSIVLVVLCLVALLVGFAGTRAAAVDQQKGLNSIALLEQRMEDYKTVTLALEGKISYADASAELTARQTQHDEDASQHKTDLATYTATRSGLNEGIKALDEAEAALNEGKAQYEAGLREFEKQEAAFWAGYNQFVEGKHQLEAGWAQYQLIAGLLATVRLELDNLKIIDEIITDEENQDKQALVDATLLAFDGAITALETSLSVTETLKDQGGITAEQMAMLKTVVEENSETELGDIELPAITADQITEFQNAVYETTGLTPEELLAQVRASRSAISRGEEDPPVTEEEYQIIRAVYLENRDTINSAIAAIEEKIGAFEGTLDGTKAQLDAAQAEIDKLEPMMQAGKTAIEQGRAAVNEAGQQIADGEQTIQDNRANIWWNMGQLDEKEAALQQEKVTLEADAAVLKQMEEDANAQKDLEQRQRTLRLQLMDRDEVSSRVDRGMELYSAAIAGSDQMKEDTDFQFRFRRFACYLLMASAVCGVLGLPAAFEGVRSRFLLIAPVLMCMLFAAAAEATFVYMGRGHSYSAIFVVFFAFVQLLIVIPQKKKRRVRA